MFKKSTFVNVHLGLIFPSAGDHKHRSRRWQWGCIFSLLIVAGITPLVAGADPALTVPLPLDLKPYYHSDIKSLKNDTYPWGDVPKGSQTFANVPLEIEGRICLFGSINAARGLVFPEKLEEIKCARNFGSLYLYHATFHSAPEGTPFVTVVFHYEDGSTVETDLGYGINVRDWYQPANGPEELIDPKSKMAWSGVNSLSTTDPPGKLQFFLTEIENPLPDIKVTTIDLVSLKERPASCVMAMTTGPSGLLSMEPKAEKEASDSNEQKKDSAPQQRKVD